MTDPAESAQMSSTIKEVYEAGWEALEQLSVLENIPQVIAHARLTCALNKLRDELPELSSPIQTDPEPKPVTHHWKDACRDENGPKICEEPCSRCATPSSAGMMGVEAAARMLLDACPNPIFDQLKPALMGEVTERAGYTDEGGNEAYYDRPVSWDAMKKIISAALSIIAGEEGRQIKLDRRLF